jgi:GNAT superfamily N-acetyltransferase
MPVEVRNAVEGDETAIAGLLIRLVDQHVAYDPQRFSNFITLEGAAAFYRSRIDAEEAAVVVAEIEGQIAGFAYLEFEERNYADLLDKAAWLHDIYLEPEARSAGTGKALMQASIKAARELGGDKLLLGVAAKNLAAQAFFEGFGFRTTMLEMTLDLESELPA